MRPKAGPALLVIAIVAALFAVVSPAVLAQEVSPTIYSGTVTIGGLPAPDGLTVVARINDYQSEGVITKNGRYNFLIVAPPSIDYIIQIVTFHILEHDIQAKETDIFRGSPSQFELGLTFPEVAGLAPGPTPTPGLTATATETPIPTPPTGQPPTPPVVYFGSVTVGGQPAPDGLVIVARIEDYESEPVVTDDGKYARLTASPPSSSYLFKVVSFHIPAFGVQATETELFLGGPEERQLDLTFPVLPEPTPTAAPPPTATPVPEPTPTPTAAPPPTATPFSAPPTPTAVRSAPSADINGDGTVDFRDLALLGATYNTKDGDANYDARADLNSDGVVDFRDLAMLGAQYDQD